MKNLYHVIKYYGLGFCAFRAKYEFLKKSGLLKRKFPVRNWTQIKLADWLKPELSHQPEEFLKSHNTNGRKFFFEGDGILGINKSFADEIVPQAEEVRNNRFRYFFDKSYSLGETPDWFLNPVTGAKGKSQLHWCDINFFDPDVGDIKFIWEPSRFAWAYTLVRAFIATADEKYAEKFWSLFESWMEANHPNKGPNYACGQECAVRLMAMCFAFYGFEKAKASSSERKIKLVLAIAVHADRIEKNIDFAISTRTNHSLTEAAGLYTAGILFPEFKDSTRWVKIGKKVPESEGLKQIYPDGSYIQHSMNYHRLMLQVFLWVIRLAQLNKDTFSENLVARLVKAVDFLYQMQDEVTGQVPNYGSNDGALIIPLNSCNYLDYRPVLQAIHYLLNNAKLYENGLWDEDLLWFFGNETLQAKKQPVIRESKKFETGGYYTIRNKDSWAMFRCHSYKDRPAHADMLHLDLWWKGINVLRDSGTYMYNCQQPWQKYFRSTSAHNTVAVDGQDQMRIESRFLWFDWTKSKLTVNRDSPSKGTHFIQGEHYGYRKNKGNIIHRRAILSKDDIYWLVIDDIIGSGEHNCELYWQLCKGSFNYGNSKIIVNTSSGPICMITHVFGSGEDFHIYNGDDKRPLGWQSLYYGDRKEAPTLVFSIKTNLSVRFITHITLGRSAEFLSYTNNVVSWQDSKSNEKFSVILNSISNSTDGIFSAFE